MLKNENFTEEYIRELQRTSRRGRLEETLC